jgi:hypothetical protein
MRGRDCIQLLLARLASIKWILLATRNFHSLLASWQVVVAHTVIDFNKLDIIIFINVMWEKYAGDSLKLQGDFILAFDQQEREVNFHKVL